MTDTIEPLKNCLKIAADKCGVQLQEGNYVDQSYKLLFQLVTKVTPNEYYQWFCRMWQSIETIYTAGVKEKEWADTVQNIVSKIQEMDNSVNPKLRAMCVSYILASLTTHRVAQTWALRILLQMSDQIGLLSDSDYYQWIIKIMKRLLEEAVEIKDKRELFINIVFNFFLHVPYFDHESLTVLCTFLQNQKVIRAISKDSANYQEPLKELSTKAVNAAFNSNNLFDFEVLKDTEILFKHLSQQHQAFLSVFVEYKYEDFVALLNQFPSFITDNNLNKDQMFLNIRLLTLISLVSGKTEVTLEEAESETGLSGAQFKRLVIQLNETKNASLKIVSANGGTKIQNKYCQPRLFTSNEDEALVKSLQKAIQSLQGC